MNPAADCLIGLWREIERQHKKPSVNLVVKMARMLDCKVRNEEAYRILAQFRGDIPGITTGEIGERFSSTRGEIGENPGRTPGEPSRARDKVLLVSKYDSETSSPRPAPLALLEVPGEKSERKGTPKRPRPAPSPADLAAYAILSAAVTLVFEHAPPMLTKTQWRSENRRGADALVDAGATPDEVRRLLLIAYTNPRAKQYFGALNRLSKLAESWPQLLKLASESPLVAVNGTRRAGGRVSFALERPYEE